MRFARAMATSVLVLSFASALLAPLPVSAADLPTGNVSPPTASSPVLVVDGYGTAPSRLVTGGRFTLTLDIRNATNRKATDVVVTIGAASSASGATGADAAAASGSGLVVLGTGNVKFLGDLTARETDSVDFTLMSDPKSLPGVLTLPVTVAFTAGGSRQESAQTIGLVVERDAAFEFLGVKAPKSVVAGELFTAGFEGVNRSSFDVSGVTLSVKATGAEVTGDVVDAGTLKSGDADEIEAKITAGEPGDLVVEFVISYRDDFARMRSVSQTAAVKVTRSAEPTGGPEAGGEERPGGLVGGILGFLMALIGIGG